MNGSPQYTFENLMEEGNESPMGDSDPGARFVDRCTPYKLSIVFCCVFAVICLCSPLAAMLVLLTAGGVSACVFWGTVLYGKRNAMHSNGPALLIALPARWIAAGWKRVLLASLAIFCFVFCARFLFLLSIGYGGDPMAVLVY